MRRTLTYDKSASEKSQITDFISDHRLLSKKKESFLIYVKRRCR